MGVDLTVLDIAAGFNRANINTNFQAIKTALQDSLSRSGSTPNTMSADIDLNSNDLLNIGKVQASSLEVNGQSVVSTTSVPDWEGPWTTSTAYAVNDLVSESGNTYICLIAHTSGTFSTDLVALKWELFAQKGAAGAGTGDMLAANNLSDVASVVTSKANLSLGDMADQNKASVDIDGGTIDGATIATSDVTVGAGKTLDVSDGTLTLASDQIAGASVAAATTTTEGVVEKSTSVENVAGTSDTVYPSVAGVKEMVDTHASSGWVLLGNNKLTADANTITLTGLGAVYSEWRCLSIVQLTNAGAYPIFECRASGSTWRQMGRGIDTANTNDPVVSDIRISNVNNINGDGLMVLSGTSKTDANPFDRSSNSRMFSGGNQTVPGGYNANSEVFDEFRLTISTGNFEGSNSNSASEIWLWGRV